MFDDTISQRVRPLAEAFHAGEFARLSVRDEGFEVEFRRAASTVAPPAPPPPPGEAQPAKPADAILSDVVGVVRFLRPPAAEGQLVDGDTDLAFVETLGIRNAVRSRGGGRIAAVYVTDGQPVEYGQPLFAIER
jgi:biotin carboxyl carrier protein